MKRTITKETKHYSPCTCGGVKWCPVCEGTGKYVSSYSIETREYTGQDPWETEGAIDAEVVIMEEKQLPAFDAPPMPGIHEGLSEPTEPPEDEIDDGG